MVNYFRNGDQDSWHFFLYFLGNWSVRDDFYPNNGRSNWKDILIWIAKKKKSLDGAWLFREQLGGKGRNFIYGIWQFLWKLVKKGKCEKLRRKKLRIWSSLDIDIWLDFVNRWRKRRIISMFDACFVYMLVLCIHYIHPSDIYLSAQYEVKLICFCQLFSAIKNLKSLRTSGEICLVTKTNFAWGGKGESDVSVSLLFDDIINIDRIFSFSLVYNFDTIIGLLFSISGPMCILKKKQVQPI